MRKTRQRVPPPLVTLPPRPAAPGVTEPTVTMIPCDLASLLRRFEAVAYDAAARALKDHVEATDRMFDNMAAARWFYGTDAGAGQRWRSLRFYNPWIDEMSVGASRQRRWTIGSLKEIAARLGRAPRGLSPEAG